MRCNKTYKNVMKWQQELLEIYAGIGEMHDLKGFDNMIAIIDYDCDYLLKPTENIAL